MVATIDRCTFCDQPCAVEVPEAWDYQHDAPVFTHYCEACAAEFGIQIVDDDPTFDTVGEPSLRRITGER